MKGYWNDEEATAKMFTSDGWLKTGDVANLDGGKVQITGRIKEIIVLSTGEKAPPADMEIAITMDPMLEKALVIGEGKSYLSAVVALEHEAWRRWASSQGLDPFAESALLDERVEEMIVKRVNTALREFPDYAKVKKIFMTLDDWTVEDGLMTPTLKLKREKIQNLYSEQIDRMYQQSRAA
jgi:long-chain acyl-CoA synthetase